MRATTAVLVLGLALILRSSSPARTELSNVLLSRTLRIYREAGPGRIVVLAVDEQDDIDLAVGEFCKAYAISAPRCRYLKASTAAEAAEKRALGRVILAFNTVITYQDGTRQLRRFALHAKESPGKAVASFCHRFGVASCQPLEAYLETRGTAGQGRELYSVAFEHGHRVHRVELREGDRALDRVQTVCRLLLLPDASCLHILQALAKVGGWMAGWLRTCCLAPSHALTALRGVAGSES